MCAAESERLWQRISPHDSTSFDKFCIEVERRQPEPVSFYFTKQESTSDRAPSVWVRDHCSGLSSNDKHATYVSMIAALRSDGISK